jgi:hypothetical protein
VITVVFETRSCLGAVAQAIRPRTLRSKPIIIFAQYFQDYREIGSGLLLSPCVDSLFFDFPMTFYDHF